MKCSVEFISTPHGGCSLCMVTMIYDAGYAAAIVTMLPQAFCGCRLFVENSVYLDLFLFFLIPYTWRENKRR